MDWRGWAVFGLLATMALSAVLILAQLGGLTRMDLPMMLGTLVVDDPDRARVVGFSSTSASATPLRSATRWSSPSSATPTGSWAPV